MEMLSFLARTLTVLVSQISHVRIAISYEFRMAIFISHVRIAANSFGVTPALLLIKWHIF